MFAVVKIAGKQFRVEKDQTLYVPKVGGNAGDKLEFADVILSDNNGNLKTAQAAPYFITGVTYDAQNLPVLDRVPCR